MVNRICSEPHYLALFLMFFSISCVRYSNCFLQINTFFHKPQTFIGDAKIHYAYQRKGTIDKRRPSFSQHRVYRHDNVILANWLADTCIFL